MTRHTTPRRPHLAAPAAAALAAACLAVGQAHAVTVVTQDFDANSAGFTETVDLNDNPGKGTNASGDWSLQADGLGQDYQANSVVSAGSSTGRAELSSSLDLAGAAAAPWTITTQFEIDDTDFRSSKGGGSSFLSNSFIRLGLGAAGSDADLFAGSRYALYYDLDHGPGYAGPNPELSLYLLEEGGDGNVSAVSAGTLAADTSGSTTYTLSLQATEVTGSLTLLGSLTDGVSSINVTDTDATALTGSHFGLLTQTLGASSNGTSTVGLNIDFDNVSVTAVPEPASLALLAAGGLCLRGPRRCRRQPGCTASAERRCVPRRRDVPPHIAAEPARCATRHHGG
jgi:hypothetical protein